MRSSKIVVLSLIAILLSACVSVEQVRQEIIEYDIKEAKAIYKNHVDSAITGLESNNNTLKQNIDLLNTIKSWATLKSSGNEKFVPINKRLIELEPNLVEFLNQSEHTLLLLNEGFEKNIDDITINASKLSQNKRQVYEDIDHIYQSLKDAIETDKDAIETDSTKLEAIEQLKTEVLTAYTKSINELDSGISSYENYLKLNTKK